MENQCELSMGMFGDFEMAVSNELFIGLNILGLSNEFFSAVWCHGVC